jgi:hypothetical protein
MRTELAVLSAAHALSSTIAVRAESALGVARLEGLSDLQS